MDHLRGHVSGCADAFFRLIGDLTFLEPLTKAKVGDFDLWVLTGVTDKNVHVLQIHVNEILCVDVLRANAQLMHELANPYLWKLIFALSCEVR